MKIALRDAKCFAKENNMPTVACCIQQTWIFVSLVPNNVAASDEESDEDDCDYD